MVNKVIFSFLKTAHEVTTCFNDAACKERLSSRDWVLVYLHMLGGEADQKTIEREFNLSRPATSQMADVLIRAGLLERKIAEKDRRCRVLVLTEKGEKRANELCASFDSVEETLLDRFSPEDVRRLSESLDKFSTAMELWYQNSSNHEIRRKL